MKAFAPLCREPFGRLVVEVHGDPSRGSRAAGRACAAHLQATIAARGAVRIGLAADASQDEFLAALTDPADAGATVDWPRVTVFQLCEYAGPRVRGPCRRYLQEKVLDRVNVGGFHGFAAEAVRAGGAGPRYTAQLAAAPLDLVCLGLGEAGQLAGNDPADADFDDELDVRCVNCDPAWRRRQVLLGAYAALAAVPRQVLTVTLPVVRQAGRLCVLANGSGLATAVRATLHDAITTACPATLLRLHPAATLYLDPPAGALAFAGFTSRPWHRSLFPS